MDIRTFKVEQWMNEYETNCKYNLAETCIDSLTIRELIELAGLDVSDYMNALADTRLTYSHIYGSPELLSGIAGLYGDKINPENILPMHGAIGANYHILMTLIDPDDNMVSVMPTYQQHYSIPESIGAEVRILHLNLENHFLPDIEKLKSLVDENTKVISLSNKILEQLNKDYDPEQYGIEIQMVKIKKLDLPDENKDAVYNRMITERKNIAAAYKAQGDSEAQKIRNTTDRETAVMLSEADAKAAQIEAEGEAEYMKILSEAYNDPDKAEYYLFVRQLDAAKKSLENGNTTLFLDSDSPLASIFENNGE